MLNSNYNPDVLTCVANLSSDEVFTPPRLAVQILDLLPEEIWSDKNVRFLDPVSKSGVFLREIARRLDAGLANIILDKQARINHIFKNQVFGLAITELTALLSRRSVYCSKTANGKYSVCETFSEQQGNIRFGRVDHTWKNGHCAFCGASQQEHDRGDELETHAYQFIHTKKPEELFNMKFDVIVGNPPYQLETSGYGRQAKPIYNLFIEQAKKLKPRYLSMIIPSRWFAGGFGLDIFRRDMLGDDRIRIIVDHANAPDCFPGVDIAGGVCYFLWDRDNRGECEVTNIIDGKASSALRKLNEFPTFIRSNQAVRIVRKVFNISHLSKTLADRVSPQKPFGLSTNYTPKESGIPCWFIQKIGLKYANTEDIIDQGNYLNKWKLLVPKAPIAGQTNFTKPVGFYYDGNTRIAKPGECCTESWIVAGAFPTEDEVISFKSYLFTKIVRFLLLQTVVSQDVLRKKFCFIPDLGSYQGIYTDELLCEMWEIDTDEWEYIDSRISNNIGGDIE